MRRMEGSGKQLEGEHGGETDKEWVVDASTRRDRDGRGGERREVIKGGGETIGCVAGGHAWLPREKIRR